MDRVLFKNVPAAFRPAPFWSWNDKLNKDELLRQIDQMAAKGWSGYFMHSRVGLITKYLSDEWFELINACADKASETGTFAWLYDEDKWPSGFAGGEVPQNPEYRSRALVLLKKGQITENDHILATVTRDGVEYFIAKRVSPLGNVWFNGACYVDLMNPEAVRKFLECTHERYKKHCGQHFGKEIPGIFTDEPCYLMNGHYDVPALPWSDYLPDFFKARKGYDIADHLSQLFFEINDYQQVRYDFFDSATALFLESFTKQYYKWCEGNGLIFTGHFMAEDSLTDQLKWVGAAMPHYEFMHWPGIDKLGRHTEQTVTVKQVTSAVEQLGKERAFCEVFGCIGQQSAFKERKWIADWQATLGISFVNHHLSLYSMRGERKRDYPANLFYQQPWWDEERQFADYIGRLCEVASFGKRDVRILVIHPIASAWSEYSPLSGQRTPYDEAFQSLTDLLIEQNLDFHYGDETIMQSHAKTDGGDIVIGDYRYSAVIIPPSLTLRKSTLELLKDFKGTLISVRPSPCRIDGKKADSVLPAGTKSVDSVKDAVALLLRDLGLRLKTLDAITGENARKLICCVREKDGDKIAFFCNIEETREINAILEIPETRRPFILDLASGDIYEIPYESIDDTVKINAKFYAGGSLAVLFTDSTPSALPCPAVLGTGVAFKSSFNVKAVAEGYKASLCEMNVLPINAVSLYLDGRQVAENRMVPDVLHKYFYKAEDGTPFKAEYKFNVESVPKGKLFAVIECAQNLDGIELNGTKVQALRSHGESEVFSTEVNYKDVNYVKVPITGLVKTGQNVLTIEGVKINNITGPGCHRAVKDYNGYNSTEVETVFIIGEFSVANRDNTEFAITGDAPSPDYRDITSTGCPFYAGKAVIKCSVNIKEPNDKMYLRLNGASCSYAKVSVNGRPAGVRYMSPFVYDISGIAAAGKNDIEIELAGTLFNLTGPNWIDGILKDTFVGPGTFVDCDRYTEKMALVPLGIGSVDIVC